MSSSNIQEISVDTSYIDKETGIYKLCSSNPTANGEIWYSINRCIDFIDTRYPQNEFPNTKFSLLDLDTKKEIQIR